MNNKVLMVAAVVAFSFALDQVSKWLILNVVMAPPRVIAITPFFNLRLGFNTGVSFGMFQDVFADLPWILTAFKVIVAGGLMVWALRTDLALERIGLAMIAGGALGNALDRYREGAVTDFLDFHYGGWHWPTFNMADVAIVCGVALLMVGGVFASRSTSAAEGR
jgi:signal peptidase II